MSTKLSELRGLDWGSMQSMRELVSTIKHPRNRELRERELLSRSDLDLLKAIEVAADYSPVQDWGFKRETASSPNARDLRTFSIELPELGGVTIGRGWFESRDSESNLVDHGTSYFIQLIDRSGKVPLLSLSDSSIAEKIFVSLSQRLEFAQQSMRA